MTGPYISVDLYERVNAAYSIKKLSDAIAEFDRVTQSHDELALLVHPDLLPDVTEILGVKVVHNRYAPEHAVYLMRLIDVYAEPQDEPATKETP